VSGACWDPQRAGWWQYPSLSTASHSENAARSPRELVVLVGVPIEDGPRRHGKRADGQSQCGSDGWLVALFTNLSVMQHQLSYYGLGFASGDPYVGRVNENHAQLCPSPEWAAHIQGEVLPSLEKLTSLGDTMVELGPGPGAATEWLRHRVRRLVVVEADESASKLLDERFADTNVEVVLGDASELDLPPEAFDSVGSFTMIHHVPTYTAQQKLLLEAFRVLKPGGVFLGSDSLASNDLHHFHEGDDYNPVDPASFLVRLQAAGFAQLTIMVDGDMRFVARKPDPSAPDRCQREEEE
jgi:SAM-dependent methyltransferase